MKNQSYQRFGEKIVEKFYQNKNDIGILLKANQKNITSFER